MSEGNKGLNPSCPGCVKYQHGECDGDFHDSFYYPSDCDGYEQEPVDCDGDPCDEDECEDEDPSDGDQAEPLPLMRCRTCKAKFNQAKHTVYEDSEQRHVECPRCGEVYIHDDFELQPEDYEMMEIARQAREDLIAAGMRMFQRWEPVSINWMPLALDGENTLAMYADPKLERGVGSRPLPPLPHVPPINFTPTYYEDLPRDQRIEHCQKCYEQNLKAGNVHLAEFWKQELEKAKEERDT